MTPADNPRIPKDIAKVELTEEWELAYWTGHFGVDEAALRAAVQEVGSDSDQIKTHLESRPE